MRLYTRILAAFAALIAMSLLAPQASAEEKWVRVMSEDQKASVLFPAKPDKIETVSRKSPAGTISTHLTQYEREGVLLVINGTQLPRVALVFASSDKILSNAVEGLLAKYYGKKVSERRTNIDGEPAVVLRYLVPDYEDKDHPGYRGIGIAFIVDDRLYVVNSILTKEDPKARAKQQKLLGSIQIHKQ
jgi:hypothetical protein